MTDPRAWLRLAAAIATTGCGVPPEDAAPEPAVLPVVRAGEPVGPSRNPASVRDWLAYERYRERWDSWPDTLPLRPGTEPRHGELLASYANPAAIEAMARGAHTLPDGAILVLEDHAPDSTLLSVSAMVRTHDPDAADGGWTFVRLGSEGEIGPPEGDACMACHVVEPDWIFGAELGTPWPIDSTGATDPVPAAGTRQRPSPSGRAP